MYHAAHLIGFCFAVFFSCAVFRSFSAWWSQEESIRKPIMDPPSAKGRGGGGGGVGCGACIPKKPIAFAREDGRILRQKLIRSSDPRRMNELAQTQLR
jgi:hypothetical protein